MVVDEICYLVETVHLADGGEAASFQQYVAEGSSPGAFGESKVAS